MIILTGNPYSTNNIYYRAGNKGFIKPLPRQQKESYIIQAKQQIKTKLEGDIIITAKLYFGDKRKRDIDNYNKLWMDALTGILYDDDKQIIELHLYKFYDKENPRIEIEAKN